MDEKNFMIFLQRILEYEDTFGTHLQLEQLKAILLEQNANSHLIELLDETIESIPEAHEIAREKMLDENDINIAKMRADARRKREAEMASYRGCR